MPLWMSASRPAQSRWMGVVLRHAAMRGPACVPDADRARPQVRPRLADLADALIDDDPVTVADGHTPRVVAPILELLEAAQNEVRCVLVLPDVAEDSAHGCPPGRGQMRARREEKGSRET